MSFEAIHCFDRGTVRFAIYPAGLDDARILCEITREALHDLFGAKGDPQSLIRACELHFRVIEAKAVEQYVASPNAPVVLRIEDFLVPAAHSTW